MTNDTKPITTIDEPITTIDDLISNLQQLRDAGGQVIKYSLTPKFGFMDGPEVSFDANIWMPIGWKANLA